MGGLAVLAAVAVGHAKGDLLFDRGRERAAVQYFAELQQPGQHGGRLA